MAVPTKLISTSQGFQSANGTVVALGLLSLTLSQNAEITASNGQVTTEPLYFPLDANGKITSAAIWFNDELTPSGTTYRAILYASNGMRIIQDFGYWSITGASADLSTMIPTSIGGPSAAGVVLLAPSGNQAVVQPSGTNLSVNRFEQIRFADQFTGADMGAKITAAIADLPSSGGIVDATAFQGAQAAAATITLSKPVVLKLGACTLVCAANPGFDITVASASILGNGIFQTQIQTSNATADIIKVEAAAAWFCAENFVMAPTVNHTAGAALNIIGGNGLYRNLRIQPFANGIKLQATTSGGKFTNIEVGGSGSTTTWVTGVIVGGVASGTVTSSIFSGVTITGETPFSDAAWVLDGGCDAITLVNCAAVRAGNDVKTLHIRNTSGNTRAPEWIKIVNFVGEAGPTKDTITIDAGRDLEFVNHYAAAGLRNIVFNGAVTCSFLGGMCAQAEQENILIAGSATGRLIINGLSIGDASHSVTNTFANIRAAATGNFTITNCIFHTIVLPVPANQPKYDILLDAGSGFFTILNNNLAEGVSALLQDNSGSTSQVTFGNTPSGVQNVIGNTASSLIGKVTAYNNITTVSNGIPSELATVDSTGLTAAVGTTTLYAVPAAGAGQYRLSWDAKVTTAAGTSSTLGALTIVYTDPDGVAQTITAPATVPAGTIATTNAGNTTTSSLLGMPLILNCKASTNITYAMAYASNAANAMNYNLHIKLEAL